MTLADLSEAYHTARAHHTAGHPPTDPLTHCRYCGAAWSRVAGSKLDGHARCYVPLEFKRMLYRFLKHSPNVRVADVAIALDVTIGTVRSWWRNQA